MKLFALILFVGELLAPSLMATFEVSPSGNRETILVKSNGGSATTAIFSETDSEERIQDDKHFSPAPILLCQVLTSVKPTIESYILYKLSPEVPLKVKTLFGVHTLLLI